MIGPALLAASALFAHSPVSPGNEARLIPRASRATGYTVLAVPHSERIGAMYGELGADFYLPGLKIIVIQPWKANTLRHWRQASLWNIAQVIGTLAHEASHGWQEANGLPFNEDQADRRAHKLFLHYQQALGIHRFIPPWLRY